MTQYVGPYRVEDLIADLKLTNNGYLFAPTRTQLNVAEDNPFLFTVQGGTIYLQSKFVEQSKARIVETPPKQRDLFKSSAWSDGPDYEAWILNRQEAQMMDY